MLTAPEHFTAGQLKDLETFKDYNPGPLKLLIKNETTSKEKKEVLQFILDNIESAKASKSAKPGKEKAPKAAKEPKAKKEPKEPKEARITDDKDDFVFVEGQVVKFPEGRGDDAPVVEGVVSKRWEKDGVRRYIIVKDGSTNMKRQSTLLKHNDLSAPVVMSPQEASKE